MIAPAMMIKVKGLGCSLMTKRMSFPFFINQKNGFFSCSCLSSEFPIAAPIFGVSHTPYFSEEHAFLKKAATAKGRSLASLHVEFCRAKLTYILC